MDISKLTNGNVYLDGTNSLLGKCSECTLPELVAVTEDHMALGMFGKLDTVTGLDKMTGKMKWNGYYPEAIGLGADPFASRKLQIRCSVETYNQGGLVAEKPLIVQVTCSFRGTPLGALVAQGNTEFEQNYTATYIRVELDGAELVEIDVHNNVWRVNGKDVRAQYRANLGL